MLSGTQDDICFEQKSVTKHGVEKSSAVGLGADEYMKVRSGSTSFQERTMPIMLVLAYDFMAVAEGHHDVYFWVLHHQ